MSLAQLAWTLHNLCRGRGSNSGHPTSPHLIVELWQLGYWTKKIIVRIIQNKCELQYSRIN